MFMLTPDLSTPVYCQGGVPLGLVGDHHCWRGSSSGINIRCFPNRCHTFGWERCLSRGAAAFLSAYAFIGVRSGDGWRYCGFGGCWVFAHCVLERFFFFGGGGGGSDVQPKTFVGLSKSTFPFHGWMNGSGGTPTPLFLRSVL